MTYLKFNLHKVEPKFVKIKLNFIVLTQYNYNVETSLIHKIKMLDEASQRDLLKFLDEFYIKAK